MRHPAAYVSVIVPVGCDGESVKNEEQPGNACFFPCQIYICRVKYRNVD